MINLIIRQSAEVTKRIILVILVGLMVFSVSCKEDPDTIGEDLAMYYLMCPSGIDACYTDCSASVGNGDTTITVDEMSAFNACTGYCDLKCDTSFLYLLMK